MASYTIIESGQTNMRIPYIKPTVAVERYELSQSIAGCSVRIGLINSACVYNDPDAPGDMKALAVNGWFTAGNCVTTASGGQSADGTCFHTSANAAFRS